MASVRVNRFVNSNLSIIILWNIKIITFVPELHFESTFIHGPPELCYLLQEFPGLVPWSLFLVVSVKTYDLSSCLKRSICLLFSIFLIPCLFHILFQL